MVNRVMMVVGMTLLAGSAVAQDTVLNSQKDKLSYALGARYGDALRRQSLEVDQEIFSRGLKDAIAGDKMMLTEKEASAIVIGLEGDLKKKLLARQGEQRRVSGAKNKSEGEAFLAENGNKEGVITLEDGLQYRILKAGDGNKPKPGDTVTCNYRGTLINGAEFDSSFKRSQPATFALNRVIKGFSEALQLMPAGSKWQVFVPPSLAYGERGASRTIGPNATLVFEVELLAINETDSHDSVSN